ncbi:expressed unknown protein [Ectocarpus siliculosus]|uniref:Uncharacterized protein n=1 Tax=Ectocarpus siliculosus TaxID=2880 RepID=D7FIA9_ECTSI|nr:expressed unknown protein [Ectocarpus siliculosus]|eukprot:CBJ28733.1 expressed unknown protein [Ectocarpus siliculosus]
MTSSVERANILESPGYGRPKGETDGALPPRATWSARTVMEKRRTRDGEILRWRTSLWGRSGTGKTEHGNITSFRPNSTAAYSLRRGTTDRAAADTCFESELRKAITPEGKSPQQLRYAFIQKGSTKRFSDMKGAIQRVQGIWCGSPAGKAGAPFILGGDEETYKHMYHVMAQDPREYRQVRRYPGDWHLLLHMAKAMLRRYWGAGVEFVAKDLGTDGSKSGEGSNYRRAHHHITAFWAAFMALCREEYLKSLPTPSDRPVEEDKVVDGVVRWIVARAESRKTFAVWKQFLLHDYPAYIAFRTALRTGNFGLRLEGLRRIAPIFFITGKDKYQFLVVDHLTEVSRYLRNDMRVVSELFSVSLGPDTFARIGLDERQEVSNRLYKTLTKRILSSTIEKLAPIAQLREVAIFDFESHFIEKPRTERDRCRELAVKRAPAVRAAMDCLRESPAFEGGDGKDKVVALDGRVFPPVKWQEILDSSAKARAKLRECILYYVFKKKKLNGAKLKGATKKKVFSIPARNSINKATKSQGRSSALNDSVGNAYAGGQEWKALTLNMFDAAREGGGVVTQDQMLEMVASIGAATPYSMANATGGAKHANKAAGPGKWVREHCADGFADDPFYDADAHGVDLPVSIHQGVHPEYLEKGTAGIIDYFKRQLLSKWLQSTELLVVCYDRQELVPVIKGQEQLGRTEKLVWTMASSP